MSYPTPTEEAGKNMPYVDVRLAVQKALLIVGILENAISNGEVAFSDNRSHVRTAIEVIKQALWERK